LDREVLDLLLLVSVRSRPLHGYALIEQLRRLSAGGFDLPEGTVYPALHRLEREGLLASRWSPALGRRRRTYRLTRRGRSALADRQQAWREFAAHVEAVLAATG
jgi:PadR family transcriptional regulator, regulatory protein PadR